MRSCDGGMHTINNIVGDVIGYEIPIQPDMLYSAKMTLQLTRKGGAHPLYQLCS